MKIFNQDSRGVLLACTLVCVPATGMAAAEGLSYGYLELDYINLDVDQPNEDIDLDDWSDFDNGGGYGIKASVPINETFFLRGFYTETEADFSFANNEGIYIPGETDINQFSIGAGAAFPMNATSDLVVGASYIDLDYDGFDLGAGEDDLVTDIDDDPSDGFLADVSWRSQLTQNLEGSLGLRYTDIENIDGVSLLANVMYEFTPNWGVNLSVDAGDELMTWGLGVRYSY